MPPSIALPPRGHLPVTGPVDAIDWYYRPILGTVMRSRLRWVRDALAEHRPRRILEVGYGSGIFQHQLAPLGARSVGIDIHPFGAAVRDRLGELGVHPSLVRADAGYLPFDDCTFDAVIAVSTLEFVPDPEAALREALRVLCYPGVLVCLTPRRLRWADRIAGWLTGVDPEADFRGGRERIQQALVGVVPDAQRTRRPAWLPGWLAPYEVVVYRKPDRRTRPDRRAQSRGTGSLPDRRAAPSAR